MKKAKEHKHTLKATLCIWLIFWAGTASSQNQPLPQSWDLQTCIDYALANNIQVKTAETNKNNAEIDTKQTRAAMLPSVSASVGQNLGNYPFSNNNSESSSTTITGSYAVNASWQLFDGGIRSTNIKLADINNEIAQLDIEESKNNIKLAIIQNYLQILYANESVKTFENAVELSAAQLENNEVRLEVGAVAKSDVAQWKSQHASDKYQLTDARVTLENYKLQLKQLLELDTLETMHIVLTEPTQEEVLALLPDKSLIFRTALGIMPQIKSGELNTSYSELNIAKAKAGYLPKISLQASSGTGNTYNTNYRFDTQLKNNWNNTIGVAVSIPIYSNREVKSAVEKAEVGVETSKLNELSTRKELYANIETAYLNAVNSQAQYLAAEEKVKSSQESYNVMDEQFRLGLKNTIELLTEKNNLVSARQQLLQAKYTALMNRKVLDYYQGLI
jgi:Outer membrane protein